MKCFALALFAVTASTAAGQVQAAPAGPSPQQVTMMLERARTDGELAATNAGGWMGRSVLIGLGGGLIGTGVTFAIAAGSSPSLPTEQKLAIASQSPEYRTMYEKGYADKVRSKRKKHALIGGLVGTAASLVLIASLQASDTAN